MFALSTPGDESVALPWPAPFTFSLRDFPVSILRFDIQQLSSHRTVRPEIALLLRLPRLRKAELRFISALSAP